MANKNQFRYSSLSWVKKEIDHSLENARYAILSFVELDNPQYLHSAIDLLRDVLGTLEVADIHGGCLLAQECLILVQAIADDEVRHPNEAVQPVIKALLQLPDYLEFVQKEHQDVPVVLVTIINDLRASRDAALLSENVLDFPFLDSDEERDMLEQLPVSNEGSDKLARALRHIFQLGLLGWYRGKSTEGSLLKMAAVCKRLRDSSSAVDAKRFWWLAQGLSEGLHGKLLDASPAVKMLMGRIDRQIRLLVELGEGDFAAQIPSELVRNILFYLVNTDDGSLTVNHIKTVYLPKEGVLGGNVMTAARLSVHGPNNVLFESASTAVSEDIAALKDKLEIHERNESGSTLDQDELIASFVRLSDTVGMLGLGHARELVQNTHTQLLNTDDLASVDLAAVADMLVAVQQEVVAFGEDGRRKLAASDESAENAPDAVGYAKIQAATIEEIRVDFQACRESIKQYIDGNYDWRLLEPIPDILVQVEGATQALADDDLSSYIKKFVGILRGVKSSQPKALGGAGLDDCADVIESADFYLETVQSSGLGFEHLLYPGQQALGRLAVRWDDEVRVEHQSVNQDSEVSNGIDLDDVSYGFNDDLSESSDNLTLADFSFEEDPLVYQSLGEGFDDALPDDVQIIGGDSNARDEKLDLSPATEEGFTRVLESEDFEEDVDGVSALDEDEFASLDVPSLLETETGLLTRTEDSPAQEISFDISELDLSEDAKKFGSPTEAALTDSAQIDDVETETRLEPGSEILDEFSEPLTLGGALLNEEELIQELSENSGESNSSNVDLIEVEDVEIDSESSFGPETGIENEIENSEVSDVSTEAFVKEDELQVQLGADKSVTAEFPSPDISDNKDVASIPEEEAEQSKVTESADAELLVEGDESATIEFLSPCIGENSEVASIPEEVGEQSEDTEGPFAGFQVIPDDIDDNIYEIFLEELNEEYEHIQNNLPLWIENPADQESLLQIRRSWHTLKGSGRLVGADVVGEFAWAHEELLNRVIDSGVPADDNTIDCMRGAVRILPTLIDQLRTKGSPNNDAGAQFLRAKALVEGTTEQIIVVEPENIIEEANAVFEIMEDRHVESLMPGEEAAEEPEAGTELKELKVEAVDEEELVLQIEPVLFQIFNAECLQHLDAVAVFGERLSASDEPILPSVDLVRSIHTINGSARTADVPEIYEASTALERYLDRLSSEPAAKGEELPGLLDAYSQYVKDALLALETGAEIPASDEIRMLIQGHSDALLAELHDDEDEVALPSGMAPDLIEDKDTELVEVFLEECREILDHCEIAMSRWQNKPEELASLSELRRELHTLKGGARMAGFRHLGNLSHAVENLLAVVVEGHREPDDLFLTGLHMGFDQIHGMAESGRNHRPMYPADMAMSVLNKIKAQEELLPAERELLKIGGASQASSDSEPLEVTEVQDETSETEVEALPISNVIELSDEKPEIQQPANTGQLESVRVRSEMLDDLVNHIGEVNVYQSRIEQQLGSFGFNLQELDQTVARVGGQLRRMEMETEAQILFRHDEMPATEENPEVTAIQQMFDPLELDRYSNIQQLSRSLKESINDLQSIHGLLNEQMIGVESLLQQQSRVSNELQEGLMNTRMLQFSVMIPRLRRVVRQTAMELGKEVELEFKGETNDVDRKILDSMIVPLEHMLRNAVAHGIEFPDQRVKSGKPSMGTISVELSRDGPEVLMAITDDGAGIDIDAVVKKAVSKELVEKGAALTPVEVFSLILEPGFTTAREVSQIAGRGVGMDVVNSQVKALNGAIDITSEEGKGTVFSVHLPITLAITQALLVRSREHVYAVPLSSVEGVIQLSGKEIRDQFESDNPQVEYAGTTYSLKQLAAVMEHSGVVLTDMGKSEPVLLAQVADKTVAFHVDSLLGNREVVVKSVGPLMDSLVGVSGATILADGQIVLILDVAGLVRSKAVSEKVIIADVEEKVREEERPPVVMVVDDSITIRKVTERMLERNRYMVVTAKDGVDAIEKLQTVVPDVMLLDIEMPRMDGFELASHIRNTPRYKDIPVIMITSRTGKKHKDQAVGLGVNRFLGKPYQESVLLENIQLLLGEDSAKEGLNVIH